MNIRKITALLISGLAAASMVSCNDSDDNIIVSGREQASQGDALAGGNGQASQGGALVGGWTLCNEDGTEYAQNIEFKDDGTYGITAVVDNTVFKTTSGAYEYVDEDTIKIELNDVMTESDYRIIGENSRDLYIKAICDRAGYQPANSNALLIIKAANAALVDLNEGGISVTGGAYLHHAGDEALTYSGSKTPENADKFMEKLCTFSDEAKPSEYAVYVDSYAVAAAFCYDGCYGTYPETFDDKGNYIDYASLEDALEGAKNKYLADNPGTVFLD